MLRATGAVVVGYVAMAVIVVVGTAAAAAALVPGGMASMQNGPSGPVPASFLALNLLVSLAGALAGGWLTVRLGNTTRFRLALILAGVTAVMAIVSALVNRGAAPGEPNWYPLLIAILAMAGVLAGGWLRLVGAAPQARTAS
jgi:hypothetical protein